MANTEHHSSESRRTFFKGVAVAAVGVSVVASGAEARPQKPVHSPAKLTSTTLTTRDGTIIYYKDWGTGPAVVFSHGYPLSSDAWEDQMIFLSQNGYRVIAHDRRGFGRSSQPGHGYDFDTFSDDLAELVEALDIRDATFVGHSMGGGEVARYISRHGHRRVAKAAFIGAVPPLMVKTPGNPNGIPKEVFDGIRQAIQADRSQFYRDVTLPYYNYDRPGAKVSEGVRDNFWRQGMTTGMLAGFFCISLFSETDFTEDLKIINVPTLVIHGSDDQIVPIEISGSETAKLVKDAKLIVYEGASHGLIITHKDRINADLLAFLKS